MNGRTPTAREAEWLGKCQQVPCIVCDVFHFVSDSPPEIHHIRGQTAPEAHLSTLSLCTRHHRVADIQTPKRWISRHGDGKHAFEARYGDEEFLLVIQRAKVKELEENML